MYPRFQTNNGEKNTDKLCDTLESKYENVQ